MKLHPHLDMELGRRSRESLQINCDELNVSRIGSKPALTRRIVAALKLKAKYEKAMKANQT